MDCWQLFIGVLLVCWQVNANLNKYENYTLMRITPYTQNQLEDLQNFASPSTDIEIFKHSRGINDTQDILIAPQRLDFVNQYLDKRGIPHQVKRINYGRTFETIERAPKRRKGSAYNLFNYNSYRAMLSYLEYLAKQFPNILTLETLGKSYEDRSLVLAKISLNPYADNPIILIDAGIHAREWVAPAMAMYLIDRLLHDKEALTTDLQGVDWYIIPLVNPDGYEYSRSDPDNRLWRKTRSRQGKCYGVDGNRNYGFKWGVSGVTKDPCEGETYAGPEPFSEIETRLVRHAMSSYAKNIKLYISLHSYGQYLVYPWGYTGSKLPSTWKKMDAMAKAFSRAVVSAGGRPFKVMSAGQWYPAAGGSDDFAFGAIGVPYSYTMELTDGYDFVFPKSNLRKTLPTYYAGFRVLGRNIRKEFGSQK